MTKLLQVLSVACLVLLSVATSSHKLHHHFGASQVKLQANSDSATGNTTFIGNSTFSSLMQPQHPSWLVEAHSVQIQQANVSSNAFVCPSGYSYLSYADASSNSGAVCNKLGSWQIAHLQGGASQDGPGYGCGDRNTDNRGLGQSVCAKTTIANTKEVSGTSCPSGWDTPTVAEATANSKAFCAKLGTWDIARIGLQGSMDGPGYGCGNRDWDARGLGNAICVQRSIQDIQVLSPNEDSVCGNNRSLVTTVQALANQQAYCNLLGTWAIARLAGGASMDGPGYGCHIRNEDTRSLGNVLCGSNGR